MKKVFALAVLLALSPAAFGQQCANGTCPAQRAFGITLPVARPSGPVLSPASTTRAHPVRNFFADRRGIRTVFLRK